MAISRGDRFALNRQLLDALNAWTDDQVVLLFESFGVGFRVDEWNGIDKTGALTSMSDQLLVEISSTVMGVPQEEILTSVASGVDDSNWKPGYIRLFISHSAIHKAFISEVADELAIVGIHGFVAHETMAVSRPWQLQIEHALRSMQAFVAIVHPEFKDSAWCHEEVGWALGRRVPHFAVRMGSDPIAFLGHDQWPSGQALAASELAALIAAWVFGPANLGEATIDALLDELATARNYYDAEAAAKRLVALGDLPATAWGRLGEVFYANDQVCGSVLVNRVLKPFYLSHEREFPPPNPPSI